MLGRELIIVVTLPGIIPTMTMPCRGHILWLPSIHNDLESIHVTSVIQLNSFLITTGTQ